MKKHFNIILLASLMWLLPSFGMASSVVKGTVTLGNTAVQAEYVLEGMSAKLGSGFNACVPHYSVGELVVPPTITVDGTVYPVTEVSSLAFRFCTKLTRVTLPEGLTRIGDFAFFGCQGLLEVELPSTLTTVGAGAFYELSGLQHVFIHAVTPPVWEYNDVFCFHSGGISDTQSYHTNQVTLHVPIGSMDTYRHANFTNAALGWTTADGWGYFNNIDYLPTNANVFFAEGDWNEVAKWTAGAAPAVGDNIYVIADVTIPDNYTAKANAIGFDNGASITLAEGGQLYTNAPVEVIVEKNITAASDWTDLNDGWRLIATPLQAPTTYTNENLAYVEGLVNDDDEFQYDFYRWDAESELQWINFRNTEVGFEMNNGQGYLYAAREQHSLTFKGVAMANGEEVVVTPPFFDDGEHDAFTLYGNPFVCDAHLIKEGGEALAFYVMNEEGTGFEATEGSIKPMQGFFVALMEPDQSFVITRNAPVAKSSKLNVGLSSGSVQLDNVIIRFGEGNPLPKLSFRDNSSKLFIPMDGKDYAVVNAEAVGEMPIGFKAEKDGDYDLRFDMESVSFNYLHLIDNITGNDVDLLGSPCYSFCATTTDAASRFKLVFAKEAN